MSVRRRLVTLGGTALAVPLLAVGVASAARAATPAHAPVVPVPPTKALPVALDVRTPYEAQLSCDPATSPA